MFDQVSQLAQELFQRHGLVNYSFGFDRAIRRAGLCNYSQKRITISRHLVEAGGKRLRPLLTLISAQFGDPTNRVDIPTNAASGIWGGLLPAYTVIDLLSQYQVTENFSVSGSVKNLADKRYISGLREGIYVGPERSFEIGARYRF